MQRCLAHEMKRPAGVAAPPTVGLLLDRLEDSTYHWTILRGALDAAADRGAHIACFVGGVLGAPHGQSGERNGVYALASPKNVDALVVLSGPIGYRVGAEALGEFCARFAPMPVCSLGFELRGTSNVCIDNDAGMRSEVDHLIEAHGIRRIAFLRGPPLNSEAELRYAAYLAALKSHGIDFAPELVVPGTFMPGDGRDAVRTLFVDRKIPVHAIGALVAANDFMALEAIEELANRGIRIPEQVAVTGFDDVEESRFALPPLTTVRQPLYEQGVVAVRHVLDRLKTGGSPERIVLSTESVLRRSCGCLGIAQPCGKASNPPAPGLGFEASLLRRREKIVAEMARAARGRLAAAGPGWGDKLVNAFAEEMRSDKPSSFACAYDQLLRRLLSTGTDPSVCNDVLSILRARMLGLACDAERRARVEDLCQEARIRTAHALEAFHASRRVRSWGSARALGRACAAIAMARDLPELERAVTHHLPALGISRCFVAAFEGGSGEERVARLVLAQRPEARSSDTSWSSPIPAVELLRQRVLPTLGAHGFAVLPIVNGGRELGLLILELGTVDGYQYETLRELFTAVFTHQCHMDRA